MEQRVVEEGNSTIDNVEFLDAGYNSANHIGIGGYTNLRDENCIGWFNTLKGTHTVINCDFQGGINGVDIFQLIDSKVIIGGSPNNGNNFYTYYSIDGIDSDITQIEVSHNKMESAIAIDAIGGAAWYYYGIQYFPLSSWNIHHNKIAAEYDAIWNDDYGLFARHKTLDVLIEKTNLSWMEVMELYCWYVLIYSANHYH